MFTENDLKLGKAFDKSTTLFCVLKIEVDKAGEPVDWRFVYLNDALAKVEGFPKEYLTGKLFSEVFPGKERRNLIPYFEAAFRQKSSENVFYSEAVQKHLKVYSFPIVPGYCGCVSEDATSAYPGIEKNRKRERVLKTIGADYLSSYLVDLSTGKMDCFILGEVKISDLDAYDGGNYEESLGNFLNHQVKESDRPLFDSVRTLEKLRDLMEKDPCYIINFRAKQGNGYQSLQVHFIEAKTPEKSYCVMAFRDASQDIVATLRQKQCIEDALAKAEEANKTKGMYISNMSHDIRTPMNAILGFTNLASSHTDDPKLVKDYLDKISISGKHLLSLVNDVLDLSRIESGRLNLEREACNLSDIMSEVRNILQPAASSKNLSIFVDTVDVFNEDILCDKLHFNQVLVNIIGNAVKFTEPGGRISVRIFEKPNKQPFYSTYEFHIKDTGIGMSPEFVKRIFEPFERERSSKVSKIEGTGLGMAISQNIVRMMGGTIEVLSEQGKGSEFIVSIPFEKVQKVDSEWSIPVLRNAHVLIIGDDFDTAENLSKILQSMNLRVDTSMSDKEALFRVEQVKMQKDPYSVVILDGGILGKCGTDFVKELRSGLGKEAVVVLTGYDRSELEEETRKAGVNAFCSKPICASGLKRAFLSALQDINKSNLPDWKARLKGKRILVAEDNDFNREILFEMLTNVGVEVEEAENGLRAVEILQKKGAGYFDLVLMDVRMPIMDGYSATEKIRQLPDKALAQIPIVALTANVFTEDKREALSRGMNDHLGKPIDFEELIPAIGKVLENVSRS